ncbi:MAG: DUF2231 domain-containing protein [Proteobacteria bacterium]|nr:DUF2231 domain-containing protein [Pseudomonadota bacterium]
MAARHPLHPALVHFPVACWSLATAADLASLHFGERAWWLGGMLVLVGCVLALPAMLAGLYEMTRIPTGSPAMQTVYLHMGAMLVAFTLYLASLLLRAQHFQLHRPGNASPAFDIAGFLALAVGGWCGGRIVYHYGIGTRAG